MSYHQKFIFSLLLSLSQLAFSAQEALCEACHSLHNQNPSWPKLAGQNKTYLLKQLKDIKENRRESPLMQPLVLSLSDKELEDLALFYEKQKPSESPKKLNPLGKKLYWEGNRQKGLAACIACHGPEGLGNAPAGFPSLKGQWSTYTKAQLLAFKDGARHNDLGQIMQKQSAKLSEDELEAIATYIEGL